MSGNAEHTTAKVEHVFHHCADRGLANLVGSEVPHAFAIDVLGVAVPFHFELFVTECVQNFAVVGTGAGGVLVRRLDQDGDLVLQESDALCIGERSEQGWRSRDRHGRTIAEREKPRKKRGPFFFSF